jgi:hypothetical protein
MRMYVGGEWTDGARQEELRSPYNGEVIDTVPVATTADVERAIACAVRGAAGQRRTTGHEREAILRRAGDIADARVDELAATISRESGKAIAEARAEASRAGDLLRLSGFEGTQLYGDSLPLDASAGAGLHRLGFTLRQPCGVVVAITPFNYPLLLVLHKIAPALAAGNAVVLKPARQTPLTALKLVEILLEAGLAPEAISCLTGPGGELGDALVSDPRVRKISFTGSTATGAAIARTAGVKKLSLELGASCPVQSGQWLVRVAAVESADGQAHAVVKEHGVDALQPLGALIDERLAQPHQSAQLEDVFGRDPGLRQPPLEQQVAQMAGVALIGLGSPLRAARRRRVGRLGQLNRDAGALELLDDEAPAGGRLHRSLDVLTRPAAQERAQGRAIGRRDPPSRHLPGRGVHGVVGDLCAMHVEPDNNGQAGPPRPRGTRRTQRSPPVGRRPVTCHPSRTYRLPGHIAELKLAASVRLDPSRPYGG